jgi:hypothetical protein
VSTLGLQGAAGAQETTTPAAFPCGKIGPLQISRLLLGGNLLTHFTHSRDLKYVYTLTANYNTDDKIVQTLKIAEQHGVNTLVVHTVPHVIGLLANYRKEMGGKMQWIVCPTAQPDQDRAGYVKQVQELVAEKCEAIYLWGVTGDRLASEKNADAIKDAVAIAHDAGVPSGVGGHDLEVVRFCEDNNVPTDFYIKTFHHHNYPTSPKPEEISGPHSEIPGYWCREPKDTIDTMAAVEKPWFAFKVMAAGAIPPKTPSTTPTTTAQTTSSPACSTSKSPRTSKSPKTPSPSQHNANAPGAAK